MDDRCPLCGVPLGNTPYAFCSACRERLNESPHQAVSDVSTRTRPASPAAGAEIIGLDGKTCEELAWELRHGARFVVFRYCVSIVILTFLAFEPGVLHPAQPRHDAVRFRVQLAFGLRRLVEHSVGPDSYDWCLGDERKGR
jgi:hypothetical protein